jgi:predicted Zn finger-like uncharacterized protein
MRKNDVTCPECGAGFRRIELTSAPGIKGQYRCPTCDTVLENFEGHHLVAYRLTIQPMKSKRPIAVMQH